MAQSKLLKTLRKQAFENIARKREEACYQYFLVSHSVYIQLEINFIICVSFDHLPHSPEFNVLKNAFENIIEKGENINNHHFLLFLQCFHPY